MSVIFLLPTLPPVSRRRYHSAFTLIELLVVISVLAILAAVLLPAVGMVRDASRTSICQSNLRQVGMGVMVYAQDNEGLLIPAYRGANYAPAGPAAWPDLPGWPWSQPWNWRGAMEMAGTLGNAKVINSGAGVAVMKCPVQSRQKPTSASDAGWSVVSAFGLNACYGLNSRLTEVNPGVTPHMPDQGTAIGRIGRASEVLLAGDGTWNINSYHVAIGPTSPFEYPHRDRMCVVYLDGHVGTQTRAWMISAGVQATPAGAGSGGYVFWLGNL